MKKLRMPPSIPPQRGAALLIALLMLLVVMMLGVSAAQLTLMNEKSSRNDRDRQIAFQAAEAALRDAERDLAGGRIHTDAFPDRAGACHAAGASAGLCLPAAGTPQWRLIDFLAPAPSLAYGQFTGYAFPHGGASLPARPPRYLVELLRLQKPNAEAALRYRITAIGFGMRTATQVVLQTVHDGDATPPRRLSWREIGNWQD
ncbi:PilX N-terminal domain-containing pilus assembly protein [Herbaspirillum sp. RV1423]|uniref:pilus assembly PilX family protein n=1 Tax=Herbaspirillum sp. RV1423 TaxID=1443993 RepID=UPI0004B65A4C|nr:PilX N-terminal domain-containing pilus assembly protein [Herbaspirillum sp. RV1423]